MDIKKPKILIVDDEAVIRSMLIAILEDSYDIISADNSFEAIRLSREDAPDLILLDITMPIFDGHELCQLLKADPATKHIPIVFITARASAEEETKGLEAGAADYISKPINPSIVVARVKNQVEIKLQRDYLQRLSTIDPLTEIANRRWFDVCMDREWRRSKRDKTPLSLLMIDIDCFKLYNDNYGHVAGDKCLIEISQRLKAVPHRAGDLLARIGGEEFGVILPDTPFEYLDFMAEKFLATIRNAQILHEHSVIEKFVTISIGASTVIPSPESDQLEFVNKTDTLLYKAKENGKNKTCVESSIIAE